ncbi:hypothetical protein BDP55DRAFT_377330 [Colletotrichum godetiae]|uniref:Uncharacterized protein n=1 Tax=Colletotrichum godetiae TaxID=1209918 RepID=A0AAJ0EZJ8_9PEZI|nr:uncharacterized protein BDP55DRAFT_377330 [Colletotrichum godetiae]KAK1689741.1 hypothetical protein BDP55DRAFT_377330 [Colletotrichum godetiae]
MRSLSEVLTCPARSIEFIPPMLQYNLNLEDHRMSWSIDGPPGLVEKPYKSPFGKMPCQTRSATRRAASLDCIETLVHMREAALANTEPARSSSTSPAPSHSPHVYGPHIPRPTSPTPGQPPVGSNEDLYRRMRLQQESRYFTESNCREEGNHTSPSSSSAAATVFTSEPLSTRSSGLISSSPEDSSEDHRSGAAGDGTYDSQATESAPEDDELSHEEVEEE